MTGDTLAMVREFHDKFELTSHISDAPRHLPLDVALMCVQALVEETGELAHALGKRDLVGVLDALCDLQYFLDGTFIACGLSDVKVAAVAEVHRSNMTKLWPDGRPRRDTSGRVMKGPDYEPPVLEQFIPELASHDGAPRGGPGWREQFRNILGKGPFPWRDFS